MNITPDGKYAIQLSLPNIRILRAMVHLAFVGAGRGILKNYDILKAHAETAAVSTALLCFRDVASELYDLDRPMLIFEEFLMKRGLGSKLFALSGTQLKGLIGLCTNFTYDEACLVHAQEEEGAQALRVVNENREVVLMSLRTARPVDQQNLAPASPLRINMPMTLGGKPN